MTKKIKKNYISNISGVIFKDIDARLLNDWECLHFSSKQKEYFEQIKSQTQSAMNNKKFPVNPQ